MEEFLAPKEVNTGMEVLEPEGFSEPGLEVSFGPLTSLDGLVACCWAWILMYSVRCLPCLPLSGLPAGPWAAFSLEAPGVTTFMGGTLLPPLCGKRDRAGVGQSSVELQALGEGVSLGLGPP